MARCGYAQSAGIQSPYRQLDGHGRACAVARHTDICNPASRRMAHYRRAPQVTLPSSYFPLCH